MYLSYFGIRVTDLKRSIEFYTRKFGLKKVAEGDITKLGAGIYVLLRDKKSGQKLELNWYPSDSKYAVPYSPGEGLDHIAFRVKSVPRFVSKLRAGGVETVDLPASLARLPSGHRVAFAKDPDGNWIELYDHPEDKREKVGIRY